MKDCGVKPLSKDVHEYLISSYIMWPVICVLGADLNSGIIVGIVAAFLVLGFLFYNMLVAMVQMSHNEKKRLRISQGIFCLTLLIMALRVAWLAS